MKKLVLAVFLLVSASAAAIQARDLISDAEEVLKILNAKDPERLPVTLRLADLLFDAAIEIDADTKTTAADNSKADSYRDRSMALYKEALPSLTPAQGQRVRFQMARLHSFKAQMAAAIKLWKEIVEAPGDARLRRESALHWAEQLELSNNSASIREAAGLYAKALPLADKDSLRSYIMYRSAWTVYRMGDAAKASALLQQSLVLASDKERDDLLRDLVLFMSRDEMPVRSQIALIENLEERFKRTGFLSQLADAYLAADRKGDYAVALGYLNKKDPSLERSVSILDAAHDKLTQEEIAEQLSKINGLRRAGLKFTTDTVDKNSKDKLFRLVHLWDGNRRANKPGFSELLAKGVTTMILLFPGSEEATQAMSGWLAAHNDPALQRPQVDQWIGLAKEVRNTKMEISLVKTKLELARQAKDWQAVVEVSQALDLLTMAQTRPVRYQRAKAYYELKNYGEALPLFLGLAQERTQEKDDFQRLSQDLTLDILATQKDYARITLLTTQWKGEGVRAAEFKGINEKARFEGAVAAQDPASLQTFTQFCLEKKFTPLSCDNARSLASKLRNQGTLLTVLKAQGDEKELTRQLEVAGRFGESARMMEKSVKADDRLGWMKVALLFELQGELKERNRVLSQLLRQLPQQKITEAEQSLIYMALKDAGLVDEKILKLDWSENLKLLIAADLYEQQNSKVGEALLAKYCGAGGIGWQKIHLRAMKDTYSRQSQIQFTGAKSKKKFEERVALLKTLSDQANCFKGGAPNDLAKVTANKVGEAYLTFAKEIRATPIPGGLDEETLKEVTEQIQSMASPFENQAQQWQEVADQITDPAPSTQAWNFDPPANSDSQDKQFVFDWQSIIAEIQKQPFSRSHFEHLRDHFESKGRLRLSGYVNGRLQDMEGVE